MTNQNIQLEIQTVFSKAKVTFWSLEGLALLLFLVVCVCIKRYLVIYYSPCLFGLYSVIDSFYVPFKLESVFYYYSTNLFLLVFGLI